MGENLAKYSEGVPERRYTVEQLKELKRLVKLYLRFDHHIRYLKQASTSDGALDEENFVRPITVKEGSYYLGNVYPLMETYMKYNPDNIYDKNMESVIDTMTALGFHPTYNTKGFLENYGDVEVFVSKGKGTMYYKLLDSKYKEDIRFFLRLVERDIDIPIQKFLTSIEEQLNSQIISD